MKFVKIRLIKDDEFPFWYIYDEKTPINNANVTTIGGGTRYTNIDLTGAEIVEKAKWEELDFWGTSIYNDAYKTGWVSPDGKFYGCDYASHSAHAQIVHQVSEYELERRGFIKISYDYLAKKLEVYAFNKTTLSQVKWFKDNYFEKDRDEIIGVLEFLLVVEPVNNNENVL